MLTWVWAKKKPFDKKNRHCMFFSAMYECKCSVQLKQFEYLTETSLLYSIHDAHWSALPRCFHIALFNQTWHNRSFIVITVASFFRKIHKHNKVSFSFQEISVQLLLINGTNQLKSENYILASLASLYGHNLLNFKESTIITSWISRKVRS